MGLSAQQNHRPHPQIRRLPRWWQHSIKPSLGPFWAWPLLWPPRCQAQEVGPRAGSQLRGLKQGNGLLNGPTVCSLTVSHRATSEMGELENRTHRQIWVWTPLSPLLDSVITHTHAFRTPRRWGEFFRVVSWCMRSLCLSSETGRDKQLEILCSMEAKECISRKPVGGWWGLDHVRN